MTAEATPEDQGGLVRHLFFFLGFVPLLSWNFFTMLTGYWMFKFRDPQTALNDSSPNATQTTRLNDEVMNALQVDFTSYMVGAIMYMVKGSSGNSYSMCNMFLLHQITQSPQHLGDHLHDPHSCRAPNQCYRRA